MCNWILTSYNKIRNTIISKTNALIPLNDYIPLIELMVDSEWIKKKIVNMFTKQCIYINIYSVSMVKGKQWCEFIGMHVSDQNMGNMI